jgi:iron complex transport system ATP-binding protein
MKGPSSTALETINLAAGYGANRLFQNLNLRLVSGQLVCFMGPNGVGKSTLIRTIAGLQKPLEGSVSYFGSDFASDGLRKILSLVLTDPLKAPYMTVQELVTFGRYPHLDWRLQLSDNDRWIIERSIDRVNISSLRSKRLFELSDGQRQMALIAKAVAQETPIMILDEPTAHLDLNNRVEIMRLLKILTRETNKAILMATHELDLALQTADSIWLAGSGSSVICDTPEDLVLKGVFDDIFKFKGFDLKEGRVQHPVSKKTRLSLKGSGHSFLWTRNALERNGFEIVSGGEDIAVEVVVQNSIASWTLGKEKSVNSIAQLLEYLNELG